MAEIQYPPEAAKPPIDTTIGIPRSLIAKTCSLMISEANALPPGVLTLRTRAFKFFSLRAFLIIAEIEDISISYNMRELLFYVFGVIPHRALIYVEGSCLLGLLISLSISKQEGNLDVLRSAGLSPIKISAIASIGAVAMMLVFIIADENYFKDLSMDSEIRKNQTTSSTSNNKSLSSKWIEDNGTFLQYYLKSDNRLYDVSLIKVINNEVIFSATSNEALIEKNYILLKEPYNYKNFKIDKKVSEKILFNFPKVLQLSSTNIKNLTLIEQLDYLSQIEEDLASSKDSLFKADLEKNIFKTIFLPISAIAIMLLAGSLTFGSLRDSTMGTRIIIGVIFSFIYNVVQDLTLSIFITYSLSIIFAVFLPILVVSFLSFLIYRRI